MVLRNLLARLFLNNEALIQKLSEFYPIRRGAQLLVFVFTRGKLVGEKQLDKFLKSAAASKTGEQATTFRQRFSREINEGFKEVREELKKKHGR